MKLLSPGLFLFILAVLAGCEKNKTVRIPSDVQVDSNQSPHLQKQGTAERLVIQGHPFLMLAGELHNSSCGGFAYMRPLWRELAKKHLNTVIAPVSWELIEPRPGSFNFTLVDSMLDGARQANLKLVLIWFGSWKNGGSVYIPSWVKRDYAQYPRVHDEKGKPLEILSTFGDASCKADARAFATLMQHIRLIDAQQQTVVMVQVENEVGILDNLGATPGNARRDFSPAANAAYKGPVPAVLMNYLQQHKDDLFPALYDAWKSNGFKMNGSWEEVFGKSDLKTNPADWQHYSYYTEELFSAWNYARYIEKVAQTGKREYALPMYVNAWLKQPGTRWPGRYPSGGPLPQVMDVWRAAAPSLDFFAPDIYMDDFTWVCQQFTLGGNPLFIPESRFGRGSEARALYAFGEFDAGCFSPFGIEDGAKIKNDPLADAYRVLTTMAPLILEHQGKGSMRGVLVDSAHTSQQVDLGNFGIEGRLSGKERTAGAIVIRTGPQEFLVAGKGLDLFFTSFNDSLRIAVDAVDEGIFNQGKFIPMRRLNGDEVHASTWSGTGLRLPDDRIDIQRISLYLYR